MVMALLPSPIDAVEAAAADGRRSRNCWSWSHNRGNRFARGGGCGGGDIPRRPGNRFKIAAGGGARDDGSDGRRPSKERRKEKAIDDAAEAAVVVRSPQVVTATAAEEENERRPD